MKILVFPQDPNPYQKLLYGDMKCCRTRYLEDTTTSRSINLAIMPFRLLHFRLSGSEIFHIHWTYGFTFPGNNIISKFVSTIYYYCILTYIRLLGYKIVWTVHNVLPHNTLFLNDTAARKYLAWIASAKIVHSSATIDDMKKIGLNTDNCHVIPMGSYASQYPNTTTREESRRKLDIKSDTFVYLHFGRLEEYKGVRELLDTYKKMDLPNSLLLIAGKCNDPELKKYIHSFDKLPNIQIVDQFIPDEEVQYYFNAADIAVYPFKKITSSSSVCLAASFMKATIFPSLGNLKDLPESIGLSYLPGTENYLSPTLERARGEKQILQHIGESAHAYIDSLSWTNAANGHCDLYQKLTT